MGNLLKIFFFGGVKRIFGFLGGEARLIAGVCPGPVVSLCCSVVCIEIFSP